MTEHELGMDRPITRRDFLDGVAIGSVALANWSLLGTSAALAEPSWAQTAAQDREGYYPPLLQGLRGNHPGAFEGAHQLRDGGSFAAGIDTQEQFDLIVVGGGISGLAAAHFYREQNGTNTRILILDNHDDFGGHAKRNEFRFGSRTALINGGSVAIFSPRPYGPVPAGLLQSLGIDVSALKEIEHNKVYESMGLRSAVFFDRDTFGADHLTRRDDEQSWQEILKGAPLSEKAKAQIAEIESGTRDYLPGLSSDEKKDRLSRISYQAFLTDVVKVEPAVVSYYQAITHGWWTLGIDAVSALDCWGVEMPGFAGLRLEPGSTPRMGYTPAGFVDTGGSQQLRFPDGNATITRLLVRHLVPAAIPGHDVTDIVTAQVDYAKLDRPENAIRIRLNSVAVRATNDAAGTGVRVSYVRDGRVFTVRGRHCVLACYNMMIPYLTPELPEAQKRALHELVKAPLVYTSVALRNWTSLHRLKVDSIYSPGSYHFSLALNPQVNIGAYRSSANPEEPMLVQMERAPCAPGHKAFEQNRLGRAELLATPFADFEYNVRDQLARMLGGAGLDPAKDILGITVNRWAHGYAPEFNVLFDPLLPLEQQPHVIGRARFGNIAIANPDSARAAYADAAIEQAYRAVNELESA